MIFNIVKDGALLPLKTYQKKNDALRNENDLDLYVKKDNQLVKFPQKDNCLINLDYTSFSAYKQFGLRSHCIGSDFEIRKGTQQQFQVIEDLDGYLTDPNTNSNYGINREKCLWYIGRSQSNYLYKPVRTFRSFTVQMRFKLYHPSQAWAPVLYFNGGGNQKLRLESSDNNGSFFIFVEDRSVFDRPLNLPFNPYVNEVDIVITYDNTRSVMDVYVKQTSQQDYYRKYKLQFNRDFSDPFDAIGINTRKNLDNSTVNQISIKSFRLWDKALTEEELKLIENFDPNKWQD